MLTDKEIQARREGLGGSDVAALFGLSPWKSPLQIYQDKIEPPQPQEMTEWQKLGHVLEKNVLIPYYQEHYEGDLSFPSTQLHRTHKFMIGHIDGLVKNTTTLVECKNVGGYKNTDQWGEAESDMVPYPYLLQCQHYMEVFNASETHLVALFGGNKIETFVLKRNEKLIKKIIEKEKSFWENHVLKKIPPAPSTLNDIRLLFPYASALKEAVATSELLGEIWEYKARIEKLGSAEKEVQKTKIKLQNFMGNAEI